MIVFAMIAGLTQWCFASSLYALLFGGKAGACADDTP